MIMTGQRLLLILIPSRLATIAKLCAFKDEDLGFSLRIIIAITFIIVTTFAVVNLLVGLIVNSMQDAHHAESDEATGSYRDSVVQKLDEISARLDKLEK